MILSKYKKIIEFIVDVQLKYLELQGGIEQATYCEAGKPLSITLSCILISSRCRKNIPYL